jgi:hypothetical protein
MGIVRLPVLLSASDDLLLAFLRSEEARVGPVLVVAINC